ncbi:MAG: hypothetical protein ACK4NM_13950, partial [Hydrogenophaga sp.]
GAGLPPPAPGSACAFPDVELVLCPDDCVISQDPASPLRLAVRANPRVQEAYLGSVLADQQAAGH